MIVRTSNDKDDKRKTSKSFSFLHFRNSYNSVKQGRNVMRKIYKTIQISFDSYLISGITSIY